ncbi:MAG: hypothetical protein QOG50_3301 [Actinomycetota bacterium]|jgi:hypothetical protein|nr:hypothetical protein [Actinomycetota bacterium]
MLARMDTIEGNAFAGALVSAAFEPCVAFGAAGDGSSVCVACGWLDAEHEPQIAEVRTLPTRKPSRLTPKRLAS